MTSFFLFATCNAILVRTRVRFYCHRGHLQRARDALKGHKGKTTFDKNCLKSTQLHSIIKNLEIYKPNKPKSMVAQN
uniref:Uncharacterized protein n=1 Tax=Rhizophora mucronata TaxID=61149 RepID=A0A2P2IPZ6_RHIMU